MESQLIAFGMVNGHGVQQTAMRVSEVLTQVPWKLEAPKELGEYQRWAAFLQTTLVVRIVFNFLQRPAVSRSLKLLISRESSRGARERTHRQKVKLRQGWSGCWLVPFPLLPPHRPHPLPLVSRAVP